MEKPYAKNDVITCNVDDEYILEVNIHEMQQLLQSIDDVMAPGNTHLEGDIRNNRSIAREELSNTTTAFLQDFEEFEKSYLLACGSEYASIDASILQDFEVFEKTMLPHINHGNMNNVDDDVLMSTEGTEEVIKEMVNEMADDGNDTILIPASYSNMDVDFLVSNDVGEVTEEGVREMVNEMTDVENETVPFIEGVDDLITFYFDDSDYNEYDFGEGGSGGGGMDPLLAPHGGAKRVHYIKCSGDTKRPPQKRMRKNKRKYRGVIETEDQTAERLELTKIKNRETATRALERKKEYDACLHALLQKLRWKNKYLKNFVKFLESPKREDMQLQPLRRTLSGMM